MATYCSVCGSTNNIVETPSDDDFCASCIKTYTWNMMHAHENKTRKEKKMDYPQYHTEYDSNNYDTVYLDDETTYNSNTLYTQMWCGVKNGTYQTLHDATKLPSKELVEALNKCDIRVVRCNIEVTTKITGELETLSSDNYIKGSPLKNYKIESFKDMIITGIYHSKCDRNIVDDERVLINVQNESLDKVLLFVEDHDKNCKK